MLISLFSIMSGWYHKTACAEFRQFSKIFLNQLSIGVVNTCRHRADSQLLMKILHDLVRGCYKQWNEKISTKSYSECRNINESCWVPLCSLENKQSIRFHTFDREVFYKDKNWLCNLSATYMSTRCEFPENFTYELLEWIVPKLEL